MMRFSQVDDDFGPGEWAIVVKEMLKDCISTTNSSDAGEWQ
jgi:hypothetical protein